MKPHCGAPDTGHRCAAPPGKLLLTRGMVEGAAVSGAAADNARTAFGSQLAWGTALRLHTPLAVAQPSCSVREGLVPSVAPYLGSGLRANRSAPAQTARCESGCPGAQRRGCGRF